MDFLKVESPSISNLDTWKTMTLEDLDTQKNLTHRKLGQLGKFGQIGKLGYIGKLRHIGKLVHIGKHGHNRNLQLGIDILEMRNQNGQIFWH